MTRWKNPWREWCLRQDKEKGTVKEGDLGIRGAGSGRAWDAMAEVEDERTQRARPPAAHHHRRIDLHLSDSVFCLCVCLAGLGFLNFVMRFIHSFRWSPPNFELKGLFHLVRPDCLTPA